MRRRGARRRWDIDWVGAAADLVSGLVDVLLDLLRW